MIALSIDTAANFCAAALSDMRNADIVASVSKEIGRGHGEILFEIIDQCMGAAGCGYHDIERIISTTGPGSFTGVRIGLSAARAIALALSKPVIGISNLEACADHALQIENAAEEDALVSVILNARRNEVYFQQYQHGSAVCEASLLAIEKVDVGDSVLCGSGAAQYLHQRENKRAGGENRIIHHQATAPIEIIAALGMKKNVPTSRPRPLYLRNPDAKSQQGFAVQRSGSQNSDMRQ